jgi:hypothetical protein
VAEDIARRIGGQEDDAGGDLVGAAAAAERGGVESEALRVMAVIGVSTEAGQMVLARMPCSA